MSTPTAPRRLVLPEHVRSKIVAHAREGAPEEVCGILAGSRGDGEHADHRVEAARPAGNVADRPRTRYEIDPREQLELVEAVEDAGRAVVGFYHSHPRGPGEPSATDAAEATWPGRSYLIVSLDGGVDSRDSPEVPGEHAASGTSAERHPSDASVGSWRWTGEEFVPEDVRVVDSEP